MDRVKNGARPRIVEVRSSGTVTRQYQNPFIQDRLAEEAHEDDVLGVGGGLLVIVLFFDREIRFPGPDASAASVVVLKSCHLIADDPASTTTG